MNPIVILIALIGILFFLIAVLKIAMPYSTNILRLMNTWSKNRVFQRVVFSLFILIFLLVSFVAEFTVTPVLPKGLSLLVNSLAMLISAILGGGVLIAVMRFSYDYLVDNEYKNK